MKMSFRWFGKTDKVTLSDIKQIPGVSGIVSAVNDIPAGEIWPLDAINQLKQTIEEHGFRLDVIESLPVHEDIKLGLPTRDKYIENYQKTLRNISKAEIQTVCYNFMPIFDWTRTSLNHLLEDGSTTLLFDEAELKRTHLLEEINILPGWDTSYTKQQIRGLIDSYAGIRDEQLWNHLEYFIKAVMPVAEEENIKMAIHPDDPPWSIFGIPRLMTNKGNLDRLLQIYDSESNGLCICTGSLGVSLENDIPEIIRYFGRKKRVHYVHARNVKVIGHKSFYESSHQTEEGSLNMVEVMKALIDIGFAGPLRPDHGRMIWGETGMAGYGLYDRALGSAYLNGLKEALASNERGTRT